MTRPSFSSPMSPWRRAGRAATHAIALAGALALVTACGGDDAGSGGGTSTLTLTFKGLTPLKNGFHYEGWAIVGGKALSTGKFNVGAQGGLVTLDGKPIAGGAFPQTRDIGGATAFVLTIEPKGDSDTTPAATHHLAGTLTGGTATLTLGAKQSLGSDFTSAAGSYILATPTNGMNTNEKSGIWFLDSGKASLTLPKLPKGWSYEGWAVIKGTPVSSGRFTDVAKADASAPYSGSKAGPPFPGEDFLENAPQGLTFPTDLSGQKVVISVEPDPDDAPTPFALKPLAATVPTNAKDHTKYTLTNAASSFPTGTATIR